MLRVQLYIYIFFFFVYVWAKGWTLVEVIQTPAIYVAWEQQYRRSIYSSFFSFLLASSSFSVFYLQYPCPFIASIYSCLVFGNTTTTLLCVALTLHVKYLQFVESITQCSLHLRRPYDLQTQRNTMQGSALQQQYNTTCSCISLNVWFISVVVHSPWKVWITCLVAKVFSITLLSPTC